MNPHLVLLVGFGGGSLRRTCATLTDTVNVTLAVLDQVRLARAEEIDDLQLAGEIVADNPENLKRAVLDLAADGQAVDGVLTFSEEFVDLAAQLAQALSLPGHSERTVRLLKDKYLQRRALDRVGIPVPAHRSIQVGKPLADDLTRFNYPAVLKPREGGGSVNTFPIANYGELTKMLTQIPAGAYILEERLIGVPWHDDNRFAPYVSVESVVQAGNINTVCVTDRFPLAEPFLETGCMLPSSLSSEQKLVIEDAANLALTSIGFTDGIAHTEIMLTAAGPMLIEINGRAGGPIPELVALCSDADIALMAAHVALGTAGAFRRPHFKGHAMVYLPRHPIGVWVTALKFSDLCLLSVGSTGRW